MMTSEYPRMDPMVALALRGVQQEQLREELACLYVASCRRRQWLEAHPELRMPRKRTGHIEEGYWP